MIYKVFESEVESSEYLVAAKLSGNRVTPKDEFDIFHIAFLKEQSDNPLIGINYTIF